MNGPRVKISPTAGKIRSRLKNGRWRAKRSDTGIIRGIKNTSNNGKIIFSPVITVIIGTSLYLASISTIFIAIVILYLDKKKGVCPLFIKELYAFGTKK